MENFDTLSDLTMIDNIEFEEKVDIGTLVLTTEPLKIPKIEFTDNENELLENARSNCEERKEFTLKMEENILKLYEELDKEKSEHPVMKFRLRRSLKISQFVERINDDVGNQMLSENTKLRAKIAEVTEEYKTIFLLNAKNTDSVIKMHEKSLVDKTNELDNTKKELQSVKKTNSELLQKIRELETNKNTFEKNVSLEVRPFSCRYCNQSFVQVHEVKEHIKIHDINEHLNADENLNFDEMTKMKDQVLLFEQKAKPGKHVFEIKEKSLLKSKTNIESLVLEERKQKKKKNRGVSSHQDAFVFKKKREKEHLCDFCNYESLLKANLTRHVEMLHTKIQRFKCEMCEKKFYRFDVLKKHVSVLHDDELLKCRKCDYTCKTSVQLVQHIETNHKGTKQFQCAECKMFFKAKNNLKQHVDGVHLKLKQIKCSFCKFAPSRKGNLERHVKSFHFHEIEKQ